MTIRYLCIYSPLLLTLMFAPASIRYRDVPLFGPNKAIADCLDPDADPDLDSDRDDVPDCEDECPNDRRKTTPEYCGCGVPEVDSDRDGWVDIAPQCQGGLDECSDDPQKVVAGRCGCGYFETTPFDDGEVECDNPDSEDIEIRVSARGGRVTIRLSRFQGGVQYVLAVQKRNSRGRYARVNGYPIRNSSGTFSIRLATGDYRFIGQVRRGDDRSNSASRTYRVNRR